MSRPKKRIKTIAKSAKNGLLWPGNVIPFSEDSTIKRGDKFTIKGLQRINDEEFIWNCKEGEETVFTAG